MSGVFTGFGAAFAKALRTDTGKTFMLGGGGATALLGLALYASVSEDTLKNDSVYARRYIGKYRKYNLEQAKEAAHH